MSNFIEMTGTPSWPLGVASHRIHVTLLMALWRLQEVISQRHIRPDVSNTLFSLVSSFSMKTGNVLKKTF